MNTGFNSLMCSLIRNSRGSKTYSWHLEISVSRIGCIGRLGIFNPGVDVRNGLVTGTLLALITDGRVSGGNLED